MLSHASESKQQLAEDEPYTYDQAKKVKWYYYILLSRPLKVILAVILFGVAAPVLLYQFYYVSSGDWPPFDGYSTGTCLVNRNSRIPCGNGTMEQRDCHNQCCYDLNTNFCFHRFPSRFSYIFNQEWNENVTFVPRIPTVPYKNKPSVPNIRISVDEISSSHLSFTFYDPRTTELSGSRLENTSYNYTLLPQELSISVNSDQGIIFNTIRGPLIASDGIWEIAFRLTNETMYGFGEIPLKEGTVKVIYNYDGGLSSVPLIFAKFNGSYHGLLVDIKDPTEMIIGGGNQVHVRSLSKAGLKFHVFVGPKPENVMRDVKKLIKSASQLEYWMLGAHICNEIEEAPTEALGRLTEFITSATQAGLPYDSHCGTAPIVLENCSNEQTYIDEGGRLVKTVNKRFIPHLSPYIRYEEINATDTENDTVTTTLSPLIEGTTHIGEEEECVDLKVDFPEFMIRNDKGEIYIGIVENRTVIYPTYRNVTEEFMQNLWPYHEELDGVFLVNSWPLDEAIKNHSYAYSALAYYSEHFEKAFYKTLLWNTTLPDGTDYFHEHNLYSNNFMDAVKFASDGIPTWSTSQYMRDVMINRQNIRTSWSNFHKELIEAALGGISGHWLWSSPICGDTDNYNSTIQTELCIKWYLASTFMPMIKIHSKGVERHPLSFDGFERSITLNALRKRLTLMPHFFTVLQDGPLLRPMFYQFPDAEYLANVTSQFGVGDDLLIVPNLLPNQRHVHVRIPPGNWFELWGGLELDGEEGDIITMTDTMSDILTFLRAGSIIVMQKNPSVTAEITRQQAFLSLTIALNHEIINVTNHENITSEVETYHAAGKMFINENLTLSFDADEEKLTVTAIGDDLEPLCGLNAVSNRFITELKIFGLPYELNNYDNYRLISVVVILCNLESQEEIVYFYT